MLLLRKIGEFRVDMIWIFGIQKLQNLVKRANLYSHVTLQRTLYHTPVKESRSQARSGFLFLRGQALHRANDNDTIRNLDFSHV